MTQLHFAH